MLSFPWNRASTGCSSSSAPPLNWRCNYLFTSGRSILQPHKFGALDKNLHIHKKTISSFCDWNIGNEWRLPETLFLSNMNSVATIFHFVAQLDCEEFGEVHFYVLLNFFFLSFFFWRIQLNASSHVINIYSYLKYFRNLYRCVENHPTCVRKFASYSILFHVPRRKREYVYSLPELLILCYR